MMLGQLSNREIMHVLRVVVDELQLNYSDVVTNKKGDNEVTEAKAIVMMILDKNGLYHYQIAEIFGMHRVAVSTCISNGKYWRQFYAGFRLKYERCERRVQRNENV